MMHLINTIRLYKLNFWNAMTRLCEQRASIASVRYNSGWRL